MNKIRKKLHFNAFVMNTVSHIHHGQWRRPDAKQSEFNDVNLWIELAKLLEAAKFDAIFFADVTGLYGDADSEFDIYAKEGLQIPSNDPIVLLSALAAHTKDIGLALTSNILQSHPFHFARQLSTLDHISNGRVGWNIVTGVQDNGSRNFGLGQLTDHTERYEWAEEYVNVTYKLWEGSWDEGAVLKDRINGIYSDPSNIHKIHHRGNRYSVEGPHLSSPSPQRTPVLFQAGSSESGRKFAAKNAEAVFIAAPSPEVAATQIAETRRLARDLGRNPEDLKFFQGLSFIIGDTSEEAVAKSKEYDRYVSVDGYLAHTAIVDKNGRVYDRNTPIKDIETNTVRGALELVSKYITDREPTIADLVYLRTHNPHTCIVGTAEQIADKIEEWQEAGIDGINVVNWVIPGSFEEFADEILPVLRTRGLAQSEYVSGSFREKIFGSAFLNERHPAARYRGAFRGHDKLRG
ncbi:LLM class flavin-dependent oxidoreductase [Pseudomonas typographi]|uniref:LLM class flavin-dependent oxidoreductase n=1 Tax=Pseudomonas typographi TaxID=2715964 RepID=A0ABR7YY28_9PSED|nr:LLM class flavin-dependent oxidoreductase [Pseudomonas typographi]MBD1550406.1 LLM class flavin-dependent oxidoreductase [Pseudomonas typographi]MBD1598126.1 LLM class flavin-dependent oxidoreductase [Pseudomonas typographi]